MLITGMLRTGVVICILWDAGYFGIGRWTGRKTLHTGPKKTLDLALDAGQNSEHCIKENVHEKEC